MKATAVRHGAPSRERMIEATGELLQKQGYAGTGLAEILAVSGAPRGSLYFHFPGGKEELACAALRASGESWKRRIEALTDAVDDPLEALDAVCKMLGDELEASGWEIGCPIATVALEAAAGSEAIRETCADHFAGWEALVVDRLVARGMAHALATTVATLTVAAIEGALMLARVHRSRAPLDRVARALRAQLAARTA
ncbi:MAG: TetR/AcrR family transcriptional regulator [Labilithrix sp.]|nr:TetR/AcrR family transcriptional regulator [Labilithrix sp.]